MRCTTRGTKPARCQYQGEIRRFTRPERMFSAEWGRAGTAPSLDGQLTPVLPAPTPTPSSHFPSPPPLRPSHPFLFPELLRPSLAVGVTGDQEPVTPWLSLSLFSPHYHTAIFLYVTLSSVPILLKSHYWTHFFLFPHLSLSLPLSVFPLLLCLKLFLDGVLIGVSIHLHSHHLCFSLNVSHPLKVSLSRCLLFPSVL